MDRQSVTEKRTTPSPLLPAIDASQSITQLPPPVPSYVHDANLPRPSSRMTPIPPTPPGQMNSIPSPPAPPHLIPPHNAPLQRPRSAARVPQPPPPPPPGPPPPPNEIHKTVPRITPSSNPAKEESTDSTSLSDQSNRIFNIDYVSKWMLTDDDLDECVEDVTNILTQLSGDNVLRTLIIRSPDYSMLFSLLLKQAMRSSKCTKDTKVVIANAMLDAGLIRFINKYSETLHAEMRKLEIAQHTKCVQAAQSHLLQLLTVLAIMLILNNMELTLRVFDEAYVTVVNLLNHELVKDLVKNKPRQGLPLCSAMLSILNSLFYCPKVKEQRKKEIDEQDLQTILNSWLQILRSVDPHEANSLIDSVYLTRAYHKFTNDGDYPQLPVRDMMNLQPTNENVELFVDTANKVKMRLCNTPLKELTIYNPWLYLYDFSFMTKTSPVNTDLTEENQRKVFGEVIADGSWHKMLVDYYHHTLQLVEHPPYTKYEDRTRQTAYITCALKSLGYAFSSVANGTDFCRDEKLQKQMFDQFIDIMIKELTFQRLLKYMNLTETSHNAQYLLLGGLINSLLTLIHNFLFYYEPCIPTFRERGMMSIARNIRRNSDDSDIKTSALVIIAYLLIESDDKAQMEMSDEELQYLINELEKSMLPKSQSEYHPAELINALNRIAVVDVNKLKLIEAGMLPLLTRSLDKKCSPEHQEAAVNAIWNLAFTDESKQKIMEQDGLMKALENFKESEHKGIRSALAGVLWQLEGKEQHLKEAQKKLERQASTADEKHIMLSYNHLSKQPVFAMRDMLRDRGYKVWIDEDQITAGGSTLDAMSNAVENSCLVLIFFSEAYYKSRNCRAEGEYTFERNKPFIPIQVEPRYNPYGWLGLMCGSMYRYSMVKPERYESDMANLFTKIQEIVRGEPSDQPDNPAGLPVVAAEPRESPVYAATAPPPVAMAPVKLDCQTWTAEQVAEWLKTNNLDKFVESLQELDGEMLGELVRLSGSHTDTFYNLIGKTPGIDLIGVLKLSKAIKKLASHH